MPEAFRVDRGSLGEGRIDHNGSLIVKGVLTRTGVFRYVHRDGKVSNELRHPDDVFAVDAVASFAQVPITDEHPTSGRVTPENAKQLMVGNLGDSLSREGPTKNFVSSDLIIRDQNVIDRVMGKDGQPQKRFLSCGYKADVVEESGEYMGEKYDHRQTNIRGNHVAIVRSPRAGPSAKMLLDSEDAVIDESEDAWMADVVQGVVDRTIQDALELVKGDENINDKDGISKKISKVAHDHPEWDHDKVVAVAHSMTDPKKKTDMEHGKVIGKTKDGSPVYAAGEEYEEHSKMENGMEYKNRVIGQTGTGKDVYASYSKDMDYSNWTPDDHRDAAYTHRSEHRKLRDALGVVSAMGKEVESKIKAMMADCKTAHDYHKMEAMTMDSESIVVDEEGWIKDMGPYNGKNKKPNPDEEDEEAKGAKMKTQTKGDIVRIKRDAVVIGSGDSELHLDSITIEVDDGSEESLELLLQRQDELVLYAKEQHADAEEARGERDAALSRIEDPTKLDELAQERTEILDVADFVGLKLDDLRKVPNQDIKRMVVAQRQPDLINDESSLEYIQGCYNMITADAAQIGKNKKKLDELGKTVSPHREDGKDAKPGGDAPKLSYRDQAAADLKNVHSDSQAQLEERFSG